MAGSEAGHGEYFRSRDCVSIIVASLSPLRIGLPPPRRLRHPPLQRHARFHPGEDGVALADKGGDHGGARSGAVKTMDAPVLVARLSTALSLKCNPRFDFRTHSNLAKPYPPPEHACLQAS
jgi:hypothetical protein